ncbi:MAG: cupin domain-containing protein [Alphaproteobacteria bacterium]
MISIEANANRRAIVKQPDCGKSYWQPKPANGYAEATLTPDETGFKGLSMGFQTIAPGGHIREHSHVSQIELQICHKGQGHVLVDGIRHALVPGTSCFLGYNVKHEIFNDGDDELIMMWVIAPAGLEEFFSSIGRERAPHSLPPKPFDRPKDVIDVERKMGMQDTK